MEDPLTEHRRQAPGGTAPSIVDQQRREAGPRTGLDVGSAVLLGGGFAVAAALLAARAVPDLDAAGLLLAAGLVAVHAVAVRTEFRAATGSAVPTEPVLVVMLLLLPPALVPLLVLAGLQLGARRDDAPGGLLSRVLVRSGSGWHSLGPALVLLAADAGTPATGLWPDRVGVLLLALAAQVVVDALAAVVRCLAVRAPLRELWVPLGWTVAVDTLLAPVGLCIAVATGPGPAAVVVVACPVVLMHLVRWDRDRHLDEAVTLSLAYDSVLGLALVDPLTGLLNRRGWDEALAEARERLDADPSAGAVVVVGDLDHLKATNDERGHVVGDTLLRRAAEALREAAGPGGVAARLGGDEFGLLVVRGPHDPPVDAEGLLAAVRAHVGGSGEVQGTRVSISLGGASCPPAPSLAAAVHDADAAARADKLARAVTRDVRPG